jgi:hypothetical protein
MYFLVLVLYWVSFFLFNLIHHLLCRLSHDQIRLQGTNAEGGKQIIEASGLRLIGTDDLDEAAEQAVKIAAIMDSAAAAHLNVKFEIPI